MATSAEVKSTKSEERKEATFCLDLKDLNKCDKDFRKRSDMSATLGGVEWNTEIHITRQGYTNTKNSVARTHTWYFYRVSVNCILPDDVKYYNCYVDIEHYRYWINQNGVPVAPNSLVRQNPIPDRNQVADRMKHRFTQDSRTMLFSVIIDPGHYDDHTKNNSMMAEVTVRLHDPLPPVIPMRNDFNDTPWNDLIIICDKFKPFRTSKAILAMVSPFFRTLLFGDFREKNVDQIELPTVNGQEMMDLLRYLNPCSRTSVTEKNVEMLLFMADRFLMQTVTDDCEKFLLFCTEEQVSLDDRMLLADLYRLKHLKQQCDLDLTTKMAKMEIKQN